MDVFNQGNAAPPTSEPPPLTIPEFCRLYRMSRAKYYELKRNGLAPAELRVGKTIVIPHRSVQDWESRMLTAQNSHDGT